MNQVDLVAFLILFLGIVIRTNSSFFFIELIDIEGNIYGFQWIVSKVLTYGELQNCWMTISVSQPIEISKSS